GPPPPATPAGRSPGHQPSFSLFSTGRLAKRARRAGCDDGSASTIHSAVAVTTQVAPGWHVAGSVRATSKEAGPAPARGVAFSSRVRYVLMAAGLKRPTNMTA